MTCIVWLSPLMIFICYQVTWFLQMPPWCLRSTCWTCGTKPTWSSPKPSPPPKTANAPWCALTLCVTISTAPCSTAPSLNQGEFGLRWVSVFSEGSFLSNMRYVRILCINIDWSVCFSLWNKAPVWMTVLVCFVLSHRYVVCVKLCLTLRLSEPYCT